MLPLSLMVENMHYYLVVINLYISYTGFIFRLIQYPSNPFIHSPLPFKPWFIPPPLLWNGMEKLSRANSVFYAQIFNLAAFCTEIRSKLHENLLPVVALPYYYTIYPSLPIPLYTHKAERKDKAKEEWRKNRKM